MLFRSAVDAWCFLPPQPGAVDRGCNLVLRRLWLVQGVLLFVLVVWCLRGEDPGAASPTQRGGVEAGAQGGCEP